eukprot:1186068-Prorocentrum_minimum.AAC.3
MHGRVSPTTDTPAGNTRSAERQYKSNDRESDNSDTLAIAGAPICELRLVLPFGTTGVPRRRIRRWGLPSCGADRCANEHNASSSYTRLQGRWSHDKKCKKKKRQNMFHRMRILDKRRCLSTQERFKNAELAPAPPPITGGERSIFRRR